MSRYVLTPEARTDLRVIRDYIRREGGLRASQYVVGALAAAFRSLAQAPGQGHKREDLTVREEIRFWPVFSYLVVYRIDKRPLTVLAILHGRRDVSALLRQR